MGYKSILPAALLAANAALLVAQTPSRLSGFRTATGIRISSEDPANRFTLDLNGKDIQPASATRLAWRIDGREIALTVGRRPWELPDSASDTETLRAYRETETRRLAQEGSRPSAAPGEDFECQPGRTCSLWSAVTNGQTAWMAAAVNGNRIIVLSADSVPRADEVAVRTWLKNTLSTLRRGEAVVARSTELPRREGGMSLPQQIGFFEALLGEQHAAFLNRKLMTENDAKVPRALPVSSPAVIEIAKFLLRAELKGKVVVASVFDGTLAHAINLYDFDAATGLFKYWDVLAQTSFLARGNNRAGIAAVRLPSEERMWLVPAADLERVLHSFVLPEWRVFALLRLVTLLEGPEPTMIDTYRALKLEKPDGPEVADDRFAKIAAYLLEKEQYEAALRIERVRLALYPAQAGSQKQALASAFRAAGRSDLDQKLDAPFVSEKGAAPAIWRLPDAMKTDFFQFFHLAQTAAEKRADGGRIVKLRPTGAKFHASVEVIAAEEPAGSVSAWSLLIARSMIADPSTLVFALDIAKSFLGLAVPGAGEEAVGRMAQEIWSARRSDRRELQFPGAPVGVTIPSLPSLAYLTFIGGHPSYAVLLEGGMLRLQNVGPSDREWLQMSVECSRK